jgi:hypothetical protein
VDRDRGKLNLRRIEVRSASLCSLKSDKKGEDARGFMFRVSGWQHGIASLVLVVLRSPLRRAPQRTQIDTALFNRLPKTAQQVVLLRSQRLNVGGSIAARVITWPLSTANARIRCMSHGPERLVSISNDGPAPIWYILEGHLRTCPRASYPAEIVDGPCLVDERPCMDLGNTSSGEFGVRWFTSPRESGTDEIAINQNPSHTSTEPGFVDEEETKRRDAVLVNNQIKQTQSSQTRTLARYLISTCSGIMYPRGIVLV